LAADAVLGEVSSFVRRLLRRLPLYLLFPGKVVSQDASRRVDVLPDDQGELGQSGFSGIRLVLGLPGWQAKVPAGARLRLLWDAADPARPAAGLFDEAGPVTELRFDGGTKPIARVDDSTDNGQLYAQTVNVSGVDVLVAIFWRPDSASSWTPVVALPAPPTPATPGTPITGAIDSGNPKLRA
jgi:hypothetical protein